MKSEGQKKKVSRFNSSLFHKEKNVKKRELGITKTLFSDWQTEG